MANSTRTFVLMATLTALFVWLGGALGGRQGMVIAFIAAGAMNFFGYWFSSKMVLKKYRAREVGPEDDSRLYRIVAELAPRAGLPMPKVYVIPQPTPNAFATGRNPKNAAVAATEGIMAALSDDELAGVMAHELAHVKNRDMLTGTIAATFAGAVASLGQFARMGAMAGGGRRRQNPVLLMLALVVAPMIAMILRMMISRVREYSADKGGAEISGQPLALASALNKISRGAQQIPLQRGNPAHSHMFIVHPFLGGGLQRLFASHPPMEERIRRLEAMAAGMPGAGV